MLREEIQLGGHYRCVSPVLSQAFTGQVVKVMDRTVIVESQRCSQQDEPKSREYNRHFVIPFGDVTCDGC